MCPCRLPLGAELPLPLLFCAYYNQGAGQYTSIIKTLETDIQDCMKRVNELSGIKESDTGLAPPALWDLAADKQALQSEYTVL